MSPALDALVGGWQINGIWTLQAGPTLGIGVSNNSGLFSQGIRANWTGQDADHRRQAPRTSSRDGSTRRCSPSRRRLRSATHRSAFRDCAPIISTASISRCIKEVQPTAALRLQLRIEAFNLFNYVQFGSPNTTLSSATVGQVTSQANSPRQMQFGVKAIW